MNKKLVKHLRKFATEPNAQANLVLVVGKTLIAIVGIAGLIYVLLSFIH